MDNDSESDENKKSEIYLTGRNIYSKKKETQESFAEILGKLKDKLPKKQD